MIDIIRVEHEGDGIGIFNSKTGKDIYDIPELEELVIKHFHAYSAERVPLPKADGLPEYDFSGFWLCAFKSLEQFNNLIKPEEAQVLIDNGYLIKLLTVTNYRVGGHQVIFTKDSIVTEKNINSLFTISKK